MKRRTLIKTAAALALTNPLTELHKRLQGEVAEEAKNHSNDAGRVAPFTWRVEWRDEEGITIGLLYADQLILVPVISKTVFAGGVNVTPMRLFPLPVRSLDHIYAGVTFDEAFIDEHGVGDQQLNFTGLQYDQKGNWVPKLNNEGWIRTEEEKAKKRAVFVNPPTVL